MTRAYLLGAGLLAAFLGGQPATAQMTVELCGVKVHVGMQRQDLITGLLSARQPNEVAQFQCKLLADDLISINKDGEVHAIGGAHLQFSGDRVTYWAEDVRLFEGRHAETRELATKLLQMLRSIGMAEVIAGRFTQPPDGGGSFGEIAFFSTRDGKEMTLEIRDWPDRLSKDIMSAPVVTLKTERSDGEKRIKGVLK